MNKFLSFFEHLFNSLKRTNRQELNNPFQKEEDYEGWLGI